MREPGIWPAIRSWLYRHFTRSCSTPECPRSHGDSPKYLYIHYHLTRPH